MKVTKSGHRYTFINVDDQPISVTHMSPEYLSYVSDVINHHQPSLDAAPADQLKLKVDFFEPVLFSAVVKQDSPQMSNDVYRTIFIEVLNDIDKDLGECEDVCDDPETLRRRIGLYKSEIEVMSRIRRELTSTMESVEEISTVTYGLVKMFQEAVRSSGAENHFLDVSLKSIADKCHGVVGDFENRMAGYRGTRGRR